MPETASYLELRSTNLNYFRQLSNSFLADNGLRQRSFHTFFDTLESSLTLRCLLQLPPLVYIFGKEIRYKDLWIEHSDSSRCNLRQKAIVRDLLHLWIPYIQLSDIAASLTVHKNGVAGLLDRLKKVKSQTWFWQLRKKIVRKGWSQSISVEWIDLIADVPKKWCNRIARFTLRWTVNQDDDVWLTLRGTHHSTCVGCV